MTNTTKPAGTGKKPTNLAYLLRESAGKEFWNRIGCAWAHQDGQGFHMQLDTVPPDGRITVRVAEQNAD